MDSTYLAYDPWSDMAKRVPAAHIGNTTVPNFIAHVDLLWARPTGNIYSTVSDLAKLSSLFLVGTGETPNPLGIYSSTLRQMLTPSFVNDDRVTSIMTCWLWNLISFVSTAFCLRVPMGNISHEWLRSGCASVLGETENRSPTWLALCHLFSPGYQDR